MTIITASTKEIRDISSLCLTSKRVYAANWNVDFVSYLDDSFTPLAHPSFQKLEFIRRWLIRGEAVLWLDADSHITNLEISPESFWPEGNAVMTASRDYGGFERGPDKSWSAGNCFWLPDALPWINEALTRTEYAWAGLWDQDALQATQPAGAVDIRPPRAMNAVLPSFGLEASWQPGDFLIHFTGVSLDQRADVAREFINARINEKV